jgi:hypothetical protein
MNTILLIGGKCGGSTLLKSIGSIMPCLHVHSNDYLQYVLSSKIININDIINLKIQNNEMVYIIDSYRMPIERKISAFFQNIDIFIPDYNNKPIEEIINIFNKSYLTNIENYESIETVLKDYNIELKNKNGYFYGEDNNLKCIKLKFSSIDKWDKILKQIFNQDVNMVPENISITKNYHTKYEEFKLKYKVPRFYIDEILKDKNFNFYNDEEEKKKYIEKWLNMCYN